MHPAVAQDLVSKELFAVTESKFFSVPAHYYQIPEKVVWSGKVRRHWLHVSTQSTWRS